jgi:hypothetical protein
VPVLHLATNLKHETVAEMREAAQTFGDRAQKRIAILNRERAGGGETSGCARRTSIKQGACTPYCRQITPLTTVH